MLNNIKLSEETKEIITYETGLDEADFSDFRELTDTRDTVENIIANLSERPVNGWTSYKDRPYWCGTVQIEKGDTRDTMILIPQNDWTIVVRS
jgi:hypothetical protein